MESSIYEYDSTKDLKLATNAWPINQNLALFKRDEFILADSLAVIHSGYVNIIPVLNSKKRSKYVPLHRGNQRGEGRITRVKWVEINGETMFVILSDAGLHICDKEANDIQYFHCCKENGLNKSYTTDACILQDDILCVATNSGTIWVFLSSPDNSNFKTINRLYGHEDEITILSSQNDLMVSTSKEDAYVWKIKNKDFIIVQKLSVPGLFSYATSEVLINYLLITAYGSGEFCIYNLEREDVDDNIIRVLAHKLKITAIDYSHLKNLIITASEDMYLKIWYLNKEEKIEHMQSILNADGPVYGVGFLNLTCSEFCVITENRNDVKIYSLREKKQPEQDSKFSISNYL